MATRIGLIAASTPPAPLLTAMYSGSSPKNSSSTPSFVPSSDSGMTGNLSLPRSSRTLSAWRSSLPTHLDCNAAGLTTTA